MAGCNKVANQEKYDNATEEKPDVEEDNKQLEERKATITNEETMGYLEKLLDPYSDLPENYAKTIGVNNFMH